MRGGFTVDILIQALAIIGIALGVVSFKRPEKLLRYGFYAAVLAATGLRIPRSLGRGEQAGAMDILLAAFLGTAALSDLVGSLCRPRK